MRIRMNVRAGRAWRLGARGRDTVLCVLAQTDAVVEVTARGSFDDVKQQLVLAIENRGLVVNHESQSR